MRRLLVILAFCLLWPVSGYCQDSLQLRYFEGRKIFRTNCQPCHGVHFEKVGPMLASVTKKRPEAWLRAFIRNSQKVILSGDDYAVHLFTQYNRSVMPSFDHLTEEKVTDILIYIERESIEPMEELLPLAALTPVDKPREVVRGQSLYNEQCASCHFISIEGYGPALGSISKRLPNNWLMSFIKNSQEVIRSGDAYANFIYEQFDRKVMVAMEFLSDEDVHDILAYIDFVSSSAPEVAGVNGKKIARADPRVVYNSDDAVRQHRDKPYMTIVFIVITGFAAIIHAYLVIKLFLYLKR